MYIKTKLLMWIACLLIASSAYSQDSSATRYPALIVNEGDTVCAITIPQMRKVVETRMMLDECKAEQQVNQMTLFADSVYNIQSDAIIAGYQLQIAEANQLDETRQKQLKTKDEQMALVIRTAKRDKRNAGIVAGVTTPAIAALAFIIGFLIHK